MTAELFNQPKPTLGFQLIEKDGKQFAHQILEGGPAENANLLRGDRILLIDGKLPSLSPRLDWRSDDAFLIDDPVRGLTCKEDEIVNLLVERKPGETIELNIKATPYCSYDAAKHSARIIESDGKRIAHIHFWMIHITGVPELLKEKLDGQFKDCDALVLDLRGRGGNGAVLQAIYNVLSGKTSTWDKPVVALVDRNSRSAKEVIAYDLQQQGLGLIVGDRTAGAVIPASMADIGHDTMLMYPTFKFGKKTDVLELKGVTPDVLVQDAGPYAAGADPIRDAGIREAVRLAGSESSDSESPSSDSSINRN